jgi:hypothetical protein
MRKILLKEETPVFDIPEFKEYEKIGRNAIPPEFRGKDQETFNDYARKVPELATPIKQFSDAVAEFEKYSRRNTLRMDDFARFKLATKKLKALQPKMAKAVALYKKVTVAARPEKYKEKIEAKVGREPTAHERLQKIRTASISKISGPEESTEWKNKVRFYVLGENSKTSSKRGS